MLFGSLFRVGLLTTLVGGSALALIGPERVKLYVSHGKQSLMSAIDEAQGLEHKLGLIRTQIRGLDDEVVNLREQAIRFKVETEGLERDIADRTAALERQAAVLDKVSAMLARGDDRYTIGRMVYARQEVEKDAAEKLALYDVARATLESLKLTLETKHKAVALAAENVGRAEALRAELSSRIGLLEAQLEKYRAKQAYAATVEELMPLDEIDSELAKARQRMQDFERDLDVKDRLLEERLKNAGSVPQAGIDYEAAAAATGDVVSRIRDALARDRDVSRDAAPAAAVPGTTGVVIADR